MIALTDAHDTVSDDAEFRELERLVDAMYERLAEPPAAKTGVFCPVQETALASRAASKLLQPGVTFSSIPHRKWLYGVDLVRGEITVLASPSGIGKSSLALAIAASVAAGKELLGDRIYGSDLRALYINAEDSRAEMSRRCWAFCLQHQLGGADLTRLCLLGADDWQVRHTSFLSTERGSSVLHQAGVDFLGTLLEEFRPDVVVLDPLVSLCAGGNMNDNAAMSLVMKAIKGLAMQYNCCFLVIHHTKKGGDLGSSEAIGGAVAIVNLARRALMLACMSKDEAKERGVLPSQRWRYFRVLSAKANLAPPGSDSDWFELRSITLPNAEPPTYPTGDGVQAVARASLVSPSQATGFMPAVEKAVLELVDAGKVLAGIRVPYSPYKTGAANSRGLTDDALSAIREVVGQHVPAVDLSELLDRSSSNLRRSGALVDTEI